jgi:hypothetical protein
MFLDRNIDPRIKLKNHEKLREKFANIWMALKLQKSRNRTAKSEIN